LLADTHANRVFEAAVIGDVDFSRRSMCGRKRSQRKVAYCRSRNDATFRGRRTTKRNSPARRARSLLDIDEPKDSLVDSGWNSDQLDQGAMPRAKLLPRE